ncbi:hypothetical protein [Natronobeatus ordinarius]|uniref:hypothetical protein n=1 Tax=Natronobeatus ordinarius TaxID=2963433 RepID=UPI0020CEE73B|nr:hypothetical protein [Natronobeatus ordinarius]
MSFGTWRRGRGDGESPASRAGSIGRRRLLTGLATTGVAALAGCTGSDEGDDDSGNGAGDGSDRPNGADADDSAPTDSSPDDGDLGDDFTPGVDEGALEELPEEVYFGEVVASEPSFVADLTLLSPEPAEGYQKVHGENFHVYIDGSEEIEMYGVDGDLYTIVMGHCDLERRDPEEAQYVPVDPSRDDEYATLAAAGTTTIGGEAVYVFEHHITVEYLSTDTGYPVRSEWPTGRADFHSWGEVDPISPPDRPCDEA